jgi:hypothetical protein
MDSTQQKNDELLLTFLRGECSSEEARGVRLWLAESDSNKHYFESLRQIWDLSADMQNDADFDVDVDAALSKVIGALTHQKNQKENPSLSIGLKETTGLFRQWLLLWQSRWQLAILSRTSITPLWFSPHRIGILLSHTFFLTELR